MLNVSSQLRQQIMASYRQGRAKPIQIPQGSADLFSEKLQGLMVKRLPLQDQLLLRRYSNACKQGVMAVRHRQLITAKQLFTEARTPLQMDTLSSEAKLLHQSFMEQSEAYLDYCHDDFDKVYSRIEKALALDVILETTYGYDILLMHRIQLLHNLVRTEARQLNFEGAIALASKILGYLDGQLETLPTPHPWGFERMGLQPSRLVTAMFDQITSEVALILAGKNHNHTRQLLKVATNHLLLQANPNKSSHPHCDSWFSVKQAFVDQDIITFLERASDFLAEGLADTPLLWYTTIIDLLSLCNALGWLDLSQEITIDALNWENLPYQLASLVSISSSAKTV
ncbi:hypothetical protein [Nostoc sp.]|uniref:hypothetical protein n=1 Tax=Nostoc sp. TaxID=1180 RepID=UPI002FF489E7